MEQITVLFIVLLVYYQVTESISDCTQSTNGIELKSSLEGQSKTAACPGEAVVYTCTVTSTGALQWAVESFHAFETNSIILTVLYSPIGTVVEDVGGRFIANVTDVAPYMVYWGNITSTLTLLAHNSLQNKTVWCGNGVTDETESPCLLHAYGVTPSAPVSPSYTITYHATTSFSVLLEWARPLSDGGVGISNYTATLRSPYSLHTYVSTQNKLYLTLLYNQMHTLQIITTNCAGEGPPANISNIYSVSCGFPDLLDQSSNNSTEETDTTTVPSHEGSQLRFLCTDNEEIILTCSSNGSWTPDLSDVQCSDIHPFVSNGVYCETPTLAPHSHIDEDRSVFGSVIVYQCDSEYEPRDTMVSKCSPSGDWSANITALECTKKVDCGVPNAPIGGFIHYTGMEKGSRAVIECGEGLALEGDGVTHVAVCTVNASWFPDFSSWTCVETFGGEENMFSPKNGVDGVYMYAVFGGAVLLVSLPLGVLLGYICFRFFRDRGNTISSHSLSVYEEVKPKQEATAMDMTDNEAYAIPQ